MSRWDYYLTVMVPLQRPLLDIGKRGMPCDEAKVAEHRVACQAKVDAAAKVVIEAGTEWGEARYEAIEEDVSRLEVARDTERRAGVRKFSQAAELTKLRNKLKTAAKQFNPTSNLQRAALLYEWYGLPPIKNKGAKGYTTDETAITDLLSRLGRGTIKPKQGTKEEVMAVLQAMIDVNTWGVLISTFLRPELR